MPGSPVRHPAKRRRVRTVMQELTRCRRSSSVMPGDCGCASAHIAWGSRPFSTSANDCKPAPADSLAPHPPYPPAPDPIGSAACGLRGPDGPTLDREAPSSTAHRGARPGGHKIWRPVHPNRAFCRVGRCLRERSSRIQVYETSNDASGPSRANEGKHPLRKDSREAIRSSPVRLPRVLFTPIWGLLGVPDTTSLNGADRSVHCGTAVGCSWVRECDASREVNRRWKMVAINTCVSARRVLATRRAIAHAKK